MNFMHVACRVVALREQLQNLCCRAAMAGRRIPKHGCFIRLHGETKGVGTAFAELWA
jgi:hypothetical protein